MINYALAKQQGPKLKAALTRASKRDYAAVLIACKSAIVTWELWGAWPDNWSMWQCALDGAAYKARVIAPRLEQLNDFQRRIKHGDRVTILVPCGLGRNGQEYTPKTGRAVMYSSHGGWVLNMGGRHGTPGLADETNTIKIKGGR